MEKVRLTDIKNARKWVIPAGALALGVTAAAVAGQANSHGLKASTTEITVGGSKSQATVSPAPTAKPNITVNGTQVPTDKDGLTDVTISGGTAHVEVSGGQTKVTTSSSGKSGDTSNKQSGNVNINLHSETNGGTSSGTTQVYGYSSNSDTTSSSASSTTVFSADSSTTSISH